MTKKALKLLTRMRRSKSGWRRQDLDSLYMSFGFILSSGGKHDIVKHPYHLHLRTVLPRHNKIAKTYIEIAVKLVDQLLVLEKEHEHGTQEES
jgi:hypothetical protein